MIPALPHGADCMNHVLGMELAAGSRNCLTGCDWATLGTQPTAFFRDCWTAGAMNRPANASTGQEFGVGRIHDGIKAQRGNVPAREKELRERIADPENEIVVALWQIHLRTRRRSLAALGMTAAGSDAR